MFTDDKQVNFGQSKIGPSQPRVIIYINFLGLYPKCYIPSFKAIGLDALVKNFLLGF